MFQYLEYIDQQLFLFLNQINTPFLDELMRWITYRFTWIPLYIFLAYLLFKNLGLNKFLVALVSAVFLIVLSDQISVHLFKNIFLRYRPCHNEDIKHLVHLIDGCGGTYGFVSSHAANTFAIAIFIGIVLKTYYPKLLILLIFWASIVSYSRIYAGVHYPADIIIGALIGSILAFLNIKIYTRLIKHLFKLL
jgi:undecaprenyl-diphosphatase